MRYFFLVGVSPVAIISNKLLALMLLSQLMINTNAVAAMERILTVTATTGVSKFVLTKNLCSPACALGPAFQLAKVIFKVWIVPKSTKHIILFKIVILNKCQIKHCCFKYFQQAVNSTLLF